MNYTDKPAPKLPKSSTKPPPSRPLPNIQELRRLLSNSINRAEYWFDKWRGLDVKYRELMKYKKGKYPPRENASEH